MNDADRIRAIPLDDAAFEAIFRAHAPRVLRWLTRESDPDVAGDLVAETFAQVIVSAKKFRGGDDEAASAWIDGIARNLLRHFRRRGAVEARARRTLGIEVAVRSALAAAPTVEADDVASSALLRLPASEKEAITLRVLEGMSYQEIGAALNTNAVAVRQRVSRGLRTLRTQLQREEQ